MMPFLQLQTFTQYISFQDRPQSKILIRIRKEALVVAEVCETRIRKLTGENS